MKFSNMQRYFKENDAGLHVQQCIASGWIVRGKKTNTLLGRDSGESISRRLNLKATSKTKTIEDILVW